MNETEDRTFMTAALEMALKARDADEVPIGAVVVMNGRVIGKGYNNPIASNDPSAHAEVNALREACANAGNYRLPGSVLYTTLEPCAMCAGAIVWARVKRVVIAARDEKAGAAGSVLEVIPNEKLNHRPEISFGVMAEESSNLLSGFFEKLRARKEELAS